MDIGSIGSLSTAVSSAQSGDAVSTLVLKKALDQQTSTAQQLIASLPQVANNPPHLGNRVDVKA